MPDAAIDYDALAAKHGATPAGIDYDALAAKHGGASAERPGAVSRFLQPLNPMPLLQEVFKPSGDHALDLSGYTMGKNIVGIVNGLGVAQTDMGKKAIEAYKKGDHMEAFAKGLAALTPILGPMSQQAADKFASGDIAGGMGSLTAMAAPEITDRAPAIAGAAGDAASAVKTAAGKAVDFAKSPGVGKIAAGTGETIAGVGTAITGNPVVGGGVALRGMSKVSEGFAERKANLAKANAPKPTVDATTQALKAAREGAAPTETLWQPRPIESSTPAPAPAPEVATATPAPVIPEPVIPEPAPAAEATPAAEDTPPVKKAANALQQALQAQQAKQAAAKSRMMSRVGPAGKSTAAATPQPATPATPKSNVITIPSPEPAVPAATYETAARSGKAQALAKTLHDHDISHADASTMNTEDWAQAAKGAGVNAPSSTTVSQALTELQRLEKVTSISRELATHYASENPGSAGTPAEIHAAAQLAVERQNVQTQ